jgi:hypothetical protein
MLHLQHEPPRPHLADLPLHVARPPRSSIAYGLFGETLHRWLTLDTITERARQVLSALFAVFTVIVAVVLLAAVTVVLTSEVGRASRLTALSIESAYDCKFNPENGSLAIPCASKISANLSLYLYRAPHAVPRSRTKRSTSCAWSRSRAQNGAT